MSLSVSTPACAAHFSGEEVFVVVVIAPVFITNIRSAIITPWVHKAVVGVYALCKWRVGATTTCAAHVHGAEVIVVPSSAPVGSDNICFTIVFISIQSAIVGVSANSRGESGSWSHAKKEHCFHRVHCSVKSLFLFIGWFKKSPAAYISKFRPFFAT